MKTILPAGLRRLIRFLPFALVALLAAREPLAAPLPPLPASPQASPTRPRICLVLSGGGARGIAHIGVIQALEARHIPIDCIAGTSMGAIVGGLYAAGYTGNELETIVRGLDWSEQFDDRPPRRERTQQQKDEDFDFPVALELGYGDGKFRLPKGAVGGVGFERLLARLTERVSAIEDFDRLPIPFRAVATDMVSGEGVIFARGHLSQAMRASMSVPGAFAPIEVDDHVMGDGGMVANLPVDAARAMGADVLIAVNIGTPLAGKENLGNLLGVTRQMISILAGQNVRADLAKLKNDDVLVTPQLNGITSLDFPGAMAGIDAGYRAAEAVAEKLKPLALDEQRWAAHLAARPDHARLSGKLDFVRVEGSLRSNPEALLTAINTNPGEQADPATLGRDAARLLGRGDFERVDYRLVREGDRFGALFQVDEKEWGPNFLHFGLGGSTDFQGNAGFDVLVSHRLPWVNDWGGEWRNRLQIGRTRDLRSEFVQPLGVGGKVFIAPHVQVERRTLDLYNGDTRTAQWQGGFNRVGVDVGMPIGVLGTLGELRVGYASGEYVASQSVGPVGTSRFGIRENGFTGSLILDQLDNAAFPRSGWRLAGDLMNARSSLGSYTDYTRWQLNGIAATSFGRNTWQAGIELGGFADTNKVGFSDWRLGGFQRLSGYRNEQIDGNYLALGKVIYRYRLADLGPFGRALYAGASAELGNAWDNRQDMHWSSLHRAGSLFVAADTPIGPAYLAIGTAEGGRHAIYLFLGRP